MFGLDALYLARIQFAFTVSFHIIFPAITIGTASFLVMLEGLWLKTHNNIYYDLYHFWLKIFAVTFSMGVVSGLVMAYQFGTNWSMFSQFAGSIMGPLLTYEVLTAFFLEAGFLGIMLFGLKRVGPGLHFFATCMVALGTIISTFWILSANSWMHTPQGFLIQNGILIPQDWVKIIFNPSFPYRLLHMLAAAFLASALFISASAAWHLIRGNDNIIIRKMFSMSMWLITFVAPIQILIGDVHGINTMKYQPAKIAAIEANWNNIPNHGTPWIIFGFPDMKQETNHYAIKIPYFSSIILNHSTSKPIPALKNFSNVDRPNASIIFWSFRIMLLIGLLIIFLGLSSLFLRWKKRLYQSRWFLSFSVFMGLSGIIAILSGWITTEVGRQPWLIYGVQRTIDAVSRSNTNLNMSLSLISFIILYFSVFGAGIFYVIRIIKKGPILGEFQHLKLNNLEKLKSINPSRPLSAVSESFFSDKDRKND